MEKFSEKQRQGFSPSKTKNIFLKIIGFVAVLIMGALVYSEIGEPSGLFNLFKLRHENKVMRNSLDSLALRRDALLEEKQKLTKDTAYIESLLRKDLGMARPNEQVFRYIPDSSLESAK